MKIIQTISTFGGATIVSQRPAKCKDCVFLKPMYLGKRKLHFCANPKSEEHNKQRRVKDFVCESWEL